MRNALMGIGFAVLAACQAGQEASVEDTCLAAGGKIIRAMGGASCSMPAKDAGKACTDTFDCQGMCMGNGQCSQYTDMLGCHTILEKGKAVEICID